MLHFYHIIDPDLIEETNLTKIFSISKLNDLFWATFELFPQKIHKVSDNLKIMKSFYNCLLDREL